MVRKPKPKRKYVVRERVVFEYVYVVEAADIKEAEHKVSTVGDGEACEHNELSRKVISTEMMTVNNTPAGYQSSEPLAVAGRLAGEPGEDGST